MRTVYGKLNKDMQFCKHCVENGVTEHDDLIEIYNSAKIDLANLDIILKEDPPLRIVVSMPRTQERFTVGLAWKTASSKLHIQILKYSPNSDVYYFLAHEMTHIWQFENGIDHRDSKVKEGFAVWVEYTLAVEKRDEKYLEYIGSLNDAIYGDGFKWMRRIEENKGREKLFEFVLRK